MKAKFECIAALDPNLQTWAAAMLRKNHLKNSSKTRDKISEISDELQDIKMSDFVNESEYFDLISKLPQSFDRTKNILQLQKLYLQTIEKNYDQFIQGSVYETNFWKKNLAEKAYLIKNLQILASKTKKKQEKIQKLSAEAQAKHEKEKWQESSSLARIVKQECQNLLASRIMSCLSKDLHEEITQTRDKQSELALKNQSAGHEQQQEQQIEAEKFDKDQLSAQILRAMQSDPDFQIIVAILFLDTRILYDGYSNKSYSEVDYGSKSQLKADEHCKKWQRDSLRAQGGEYQISHQKDKNSALQTASVYNSQEAKEAKTIQCDFDTRKWDSSQANTVLRQAEDGSHSKIHYVGFFQGRKLGKKGIDYWSFSQELDKLVIEYMKRYIPSFNRSKLQKAFANFFYDLSWKVWKKV